VIQGTSIIDFIQQNCLGQNKSIEIIISVVVGFKSQQHSKIMLTITVHRSTIFGRLQSINGQNSMELTTKNSHKIYLFDSDTN